MGSIRRDPATGERRHRRSLALAATVAAALALGACGDDEAGPPGSAQLPSTSTAPTGEETGAKQGPARAGDRGDEGSGSDQAGPQGSAGQGSGDEETTDLESCPEGMSPTDCQALIDSESSSKTIKKDECQSVLSEKQCQALGEALQVQPDGSRELGKNQCYSVLSKKQCRELARALGLG